MGERSEIWGEKGEIWGSWGEEEERCASIRGNTVPWGGGGGVIRGGGRHGRCY